jgi:hypothetical protein
MDQNTAMVAVFSVAAGCAIVGIIVSGILKLRSSKNTKTVVESLESVEQRFARVEVALDDLTAELARLSEGQQSVQRLLAQRPVDRISS